ncbi:MAG: hypothetical protein P1U70_16000 [Saprospiraceae bacterium]|jgi:outer membrane protein assembly factor BamD (BamD/ComL family)|nr:hypothetical protein [Saprospiraceae bacterium]
MKRKVTKLLLCFLVVITIFSCGASKKFQEAKSSNSILEYEWFVDKYPNSKFAIQAKEELEILYEEKDWKSTVNSNSINSFNAFIAKYPFSKHATQANENLRFLHEEKDWNYALRADIITEYNSFLRKYPNSLYSKQAKEKIAKIEELNSWRKSKNINTIYGFQNFITSYPNSKYLFDAKNKIESLKDENAWGDAEIIGTLEAYKSYVNSFPYGAKRGKALDKIREIEVILPEWKKTLSKNNPEAFQNFIQLFPNSFYTEQANDKLNRLELADWNNAKKRDRISSYEEYISTFPDGVHSEEARKRIIDIEVDAIFKGDHGTLPPMNRISPEYSSSKINDIEIFNNTIYTLIVRYSGTDSRKIVIKPKKREKLTLRNGSYRVTASVNAQNVRNYAGSEKLQGGAYSSEYYIIIETDSKNPYGY